MGLEARIWASRLGFWPRDWNLGLDTGILGGSTEEEEEEEKEEEKEEKEEEEEDSDLFIIVITPDH